MEEPLSLGEVEEVTEGSARHSPGPSMQTMEERLSPNPELVVLNVEVADGLQGNIYVHENDDPYQLAADFASKYHLQPSVQADLANLIIQNKANAQRNLKGNPQPLEEEERGTRSEWSIFASSEPDFMPKIDPLSKSIAEKIQRAGPVYDRLYKKGKKKSADPAPAPTPHLNSSYNYGEWQYLRGIQLREAKARSKNKLQKEIELETSRETPFQPEINRYSSLLSPRFDSRVEDLLLSWGNSHDQKLDQERTQRSVDESKDCTFHPAVNPKSVSLATKKRTGQAFEQLYKEATDMRKREDIEYADLRKSEYSFKPESHGKKKAEETQEEFLNRLVHSKKSIEEQLATQRKEKEAQQSIDPSTGQPYFHPHIQPHKANQQARSGPIHEYLYSLRLAKEGNREKAEEKLGPRGLQTAPELTSKTQETYQRYVQGRMATLFSLLDSDRDGKIGPEAIDLTGLGEKQAILLTPLIEAVRSSEGEWDYDIFYGHLDEILSSLTVEERHYVLKGEKKPPAKEQTDFQPKLTAKSHTLAQKKRAAQPGDIYSRGMKSMRDTVEFREASKAALEEAEMKQCTFNPFKSADESKSEGRKSRTSEPRKRN
jgi:hypothetical protein